jgi:hypothetical protein
MVDDLIPAAVRDFIDKHIDSIAQLEALLLMRREREVSWDAPAAAARLYISPGEAADVLAKLSADGLIQHKGSCYSYGCRTPQLEALVDELATTYARQLIPVTRLVHSKPDRIRQFADAFKLRRES